MPEVAFIIKVNLDDVGPSELALVAAEIGDDLETTHDVISVEPWARPSVSPTTQTTQQNNIT